MQTAVQSALGRMKLADYKTQYKMKVITKYPIIINKERVSPKDYYLNAQSSIKTCPITGRPIQTCGCGCGMGYRRRMRMGQPMGYRKTTTVTIPSVLFGI